MLPCDSPAALEGGAGTVCGARGTAAARRKGGGFSHTGQDRAVPLAAGSPEPTELPPEQPQQKPSALRPDHSIQSIPEVSEAKPAHTSSGTSYQGGHLFRHCRGHSRGIVGAFHSQELNLRWTIMPSISVPTSDSLTTSQPHQPLSPPCLLPTGSRKHYPLPSLCVPPFPPSSCFFCHLKLNDMLLEWRGHGC